MVEENTSITEGIQLTDAAIAHLRSELSKRSDFDGVRMYVKEVGCSGLAYEIDFLEKASAEYISFNVADGVTIYIDKESYPYLKGTRLDYVRRGLNEGFEYTNPNATGTCGCGESFTVK